MKALHVILKPIVTEKAIKLGEKMSYAFYVHPKATKIDVKMAIKELYGENVAKVQIIKSPAKTKSLRRTTVNKRQAAKKAIITLQGRKKLDISKVSKETSKK